MKQLILFFGLLFSLPLHAIPPKTDPNIRKTVDNFFVALNQGDSSLMLSTLHPDMILRTCHLKKDSTILLEENLIDLLEAVQAKRDLTWEERIHHVEVKSDGLLATVWAPYEFYLGGEYSHEGVNVFELVLVGDKWQIISITDTRRKKPEKDK